MRLNRISITRARKDTFRNAFAIRVLTVLSSLGCTVCSAIADPLGLNLTSSNLTSSVQNNQVQGTTSLAGTAMSLTGLQSAPMQSVLMQVLPSGNAAINPVSSTVGNSLGVISSSSSRADLLKATASVNVIHETTSVTSATGRISGGTGTFASRNIETTDARNSTVSGNTERSGWQHRSSLVSSQSSNSGFLQVTKEQLRMTLVTRSSQILSGNLGGRGNFMIATRGTSYTNQNGLIVLHTGRLHADTGPDGAVIMANRTKVSIAPNCSAVVAVNTRGQLSVTSVGGSRECFVAVGTESVPVGEGEMLTVADLTDDDLIAVNGPSEPVSGGITRVSSKNVVKQTVALDRYLHEDLLPATRSMSLGVSSKAACNRFVARVADSAKKHNPQVVAPEIKKDETDGQSGGQLDMYASEGSQLQELTGALKLKSGSVILRASEFTTVKAGDAYVAADAGTLFAIEQQGAVTRVKSLSGPHQVKVILDSNIMDLNPGEELIVAHSPLSQNDLIPSDGVGRRFARSLKFGADIHAVVSDFSIASLINADDHIKQFIIQHDRLFDGLLKTAAAVETVKAGRGKYSSANSARL